jgi:hypothetical protein
MGEARTTISLFYDYKDKIISNKKLKLFIIITLILIFQLKP